MSDAKTLAEKACSSFPQLNGCEYRDTIVHDVEKLLKDGWEYTDVRAYLRTFEEVNPDLEEDVALNRRQLLYSKYLHLYIELRERDFQALAPLMVK